MCRSELGFRKVSGAVIIILGFFGGSLRVLGGIACKLGQVSVYVTCTMIERLAYKENVGL